MTVIYVIVNVAMVEQLWCLLAVSYLSACLSVCLSVKCCDGDLCNGECGNGGTTFVFTSG